MSENGKEKKEDTWGDLMADGPKRHHRWFPKPPTLAGEEPKKSED
jgi:hypothetical protein